VLVCEASETFLVQGSNLAAGCPSRHHLVSNPGSLGSGEHVLTDVYAGTKRNINVVIF